MHLMTFSFTFPQSLLKKFERLLHSSINSLYLSVIQDYLWFTLDNKRHNVNRLRAHADDSLANQGHINNHGIPPYPTSFINTH